MLNIFKRRSVKKNSEEIKWLKEVITTMQRRLWKLVKKRLVEKTPFVNGEKHGITKEYYESGALLHEMPFVNGEKHGMAKEYYESGALRRETPFVNDKEHGIEKIYYESGALRRETPFVNDERHGIEKIYYESGALRKETPFVNDERHGIEKCYYKSTNSKEFVEYKTPYVNGELRDDLLDPKNYMQRLVLLGE